MMKNQTKSSLLAVLLLFCGQLLAGNQDRYYRSIEVKDTGWHSLLLPPEIYLKSKPNLSDLRVYKISDKDSLEVPYIRMFNAPFEKKTYTNLKLFNAVKKRNKSYVSAELIKGVSFELNLRFNNSNFDVDVLFEGSHDGENWFLIKDSVRVLSLHKDGVSFSYSKCIFEDIRFKYLRVTYPNNNNLLLKAILQSYRALDQVKLNKISLPTSGTSSKEKSTIFCFSMSSPQEVSKLIPHVFFNTEYTRHFTLYGYRDSVEVNKKGILNYFEIANGVLNSYSDNTIEFKPELVAGLKLIVNNADNIPLSISDADVFVFPVLLKAYFYDLSGRYILSYGNSSLTFPDYDLASFKNKIPTTSDTLNVLSEKKLTFIAKKPLFSLPDNLLWLVLLAVIILLSFFTFKMINAKE